MFYGYRVVTDEDFLHDEPQNFLTIDCIETLCGSTNTRQEVIYATDKLKVQFFVNHPGFDRLQF